MSARFSDQDRRRRLVARHHLGRTATTPLEVTRSVAALHSTDPATPYLANWARVPNFEIEHLEDALYEQRIMRRMHTIRRTLFVVPMEDAASFEAGGAREVAAKERTRLVGWMSAEMDPSLVDPLLAELADRIIAVLGDEEKSTRDLTAAIPGLATEVAVGQGKWSVRVPLSTRLLFILAMDGLLVRTRPAGSWRSSQYNWAAVEAWNGGKQPRYQVEEGQAVIAHRYLTTHGPVTMTDLRWWTGWTVKAVKTALSAIDTVTVELDSGEPGFVLRGDAKLDPLGGKAVALLPGLDSTPMGWKDREWYLGPHSKEVFDSNGNAGPTVWVDGRIVGGWAQTPDGEVVYDLLEDVDSRSGDLIRDEAASLTAWLDGVVVMPRFPSPLGKRLSAHS